MSHRLTYVTAVQSPWAYLGHQRLEELIARHRLQVTVQPVDLGQVFAVSGGLPLKQRAQQRQDYRLVELQRWSRFLKVPIHVTPRHWPVDEALAAHMVILYQEAHGDAVALLHALMRAVWLEEMDIADPAILRVVAASVGAPEALVEQAREAHAAGVRQTMLEQAVAAGVFGAPTYILDGELFWGQDRLELLAWTLDGRP